MSRTRRVFARLITSQVNGCEIGTHSPSPRGRPFIEASNASRTRTSSSFPRRPLAGGPSSRHPDRGAGHETDHGSPSLRGRPFIEARSGRSGDRGRVCPRRPLAGGPSSRRGVRVGAEAWHPRSPSPRGRPFIEAFGCTPAVGAGLPRRPLAGGLHRGVTPNTGGSGIVWTLAVPSRAALHRGTPTAALVTRPTTARRPLAGGPSSRRGRGGPVIVAEYVLAVPSRAALHRGEVCGSAPRLGTPARRPLAGGPSSRPSVARPRWALVFLAVPSRAAFIEASPPTRSGRGSCGRSPSPRGRPFIEA